MPIDNDIRGSSFYDFFDNPFSAPPSAYLGGLPYGSIEISGKNNAYAGIKFKDVNASFLFQNNLQGAFRQHPTTLLQEWLWYFLNGELIVGTVPWARLTEIPAASASQAGLISNESAGTWTPSIRGKTTTGSTTYSARYGRWSRIGDLVQARFNIISITPSGIPAGEQLCIGGLPFSSANNSGIDGNVLFNTYSGITANTGMTQLAGRILPNTSLAELWFSGPGMGGTGALISSSSSSANTIQAGASLSGVLIYEVV